jgi:hypothetical protein
MQVLVALLRACKRPQGWLRLLVQLHIRRCVMGSALQNAELIGLGAEMHAADPKRRLHLASAAASAACFWSAAKGVRSRRQGGQLSLKVVPVRAMCRATASSEASSLSWSPLHADIVGIVGREHPQSVLQVWRTSRATSGRSSSTSGNTLTPSCRILRNRRCWMRTSTISVAIRISCSTARRSACRSGTSETFLRVSDP